MPQDNSAPTARWFRLDAGWDKKDWIADLEPDARLAWVLLLCYVKVHGIRGKAVALTFRGAARDWRVPERAVAEMFDAAVEAGTVSFDEECWTIEDWTRYQPQDHTTGERSRRYRESRRDQA